MKVFKTKLKDLFLIEPKVHGDERGYFYELYQFERYNTQGISTSFVQDNRSYSRKDVLRGIHFQKKRPQGKLVFVTNGAVFDVAVDLRIDSDTFGQFETFLLSDENKLQVYIPPGFAHGFCVLSDVVEFQYKCSDYYDPTDEGGILWCDPELQIPWPISNPIVSDKDNALPCLSQIRSRWPKAGCR